MLWWHGYRRDGTRRHAVTTTDPRIGRRAGMTELCAVGHIAAAAFADSVPA
jgi:hypothetical protein